MPEETTPPEGTPSTPAAPDWDSDDNPYKQRFTDTQGAYTKSQQELAAERAAWDDDEALVGRLREKRPHWLQESQDDEQDPYAERWARLEAAESRIAEHDARIAAENVAAGEELFHTDLDSWAEKDGVKLSKADHNAIFGMLMKAPDPTQESAAREVYEAHVGHKKAEREALEAEIREQMKRPRVPTPPTGGTPNTGAPNWGEMSQADIDQTMADMVRARSA